jgi:hypothetical protein
MARLGWITDLTPLAGAAGAAALLALAVVEEPAGLVAATALAGLALAGWAGRSLWRQHRASLTWCPACRGTVALRAEACRHCGAALHGARPRSATPGR